MEIITQTLLALASIDKGAIRLPFDESIYPTAAVRAAIAGLSERDQATVEEVDGQMWIAVVAVDRPTQAREVLGHVLNSCLREALRVSTSR
jgi:hypothetical protein